MDVKFTLGPNTFTRKVTQTNDKGEVIVTDQEEEISFKSTEVLLEDGDNQQILTKKQTKFAYVYLNGKKEIHVYQNDHILQKYDFDNDTFSTLKAVDTPEKLIDKLNKLFAS